MTEFGKTLREAREAKGLTISQIAEQTHLLPQIVGDLENDDFHRISAPIYGRGFIKLYCETVGLDPKPLVDEFMAILNGERTPAIRVRDVELPPEEPAPPAQPAEPVPPPPPVYVQPELGEKPMEATVRGEGLSQQGTINLHAEDARHEMRDTSTSRETSDVNSRLSTPDSQLSAEPVPPPTRQYHPDYAHAALGASVNFGRLAILAGGAILVLILLFFGCRALYRASMGIPATSEASQELAAEGEAGEKPAETATAKPVDAASSPRQGKASGKSTANPVDAASSPRQGKASGKSTAKPADAKGASKPAKSAAKAPRTPKSVPPLYID